MTKFFALEGPLSMGTFILIIVVLLAGIWLGFGTGFVTGASWMKREAAKDHPRKKIATSSRLPIAMGGSFLLIALV